MGVKDISDCMREDCVLKNVRSPRGEYSQANPHFPLKPRGFNLTPQEKRNFSSVRLCSCLVCAILL